MENDILRMVLILIGVAVLAGVYFWDRYQKEQRLKFGRRQDPVDYPAEHNSFAADEPGADELDAELNRLSQVMTRDNSPEVETAPGESVGKARVVYSAPQQRSAPAADVPEKLIQLRVVGLGNAVFKARDIHNAAQAVGLTYDNREYFVRKHGGSGPETFIVASLAEPGLLPHAEDDDFRTPGLVMMLPLPGDETGMDMFSDMLASAERMAAILHGEIRDQSHSVLNKQMVDHLREEIMEHTRQVKLERMRG